MRPAARANAVHETPWLPTHSEHGDGRGIVRPLAEGHQLRHAAIVQVKSGSENSDRMEAVPTIRNVRVAAIHVPRRRVEVHEHVAQHGRWSPRIETDARET